LVVLYEAYKLCAIRSHSSAISTFNYAIIYVYPLSLRLLSK